MLWLYLLIPLIILLGAAVMINRRRRRSISYDGESGGATYSGPGEATARGISEVARAAREISADVDMPGSRDRQLGRSVCAAGQPAYSQVRRRTGLSASDRKYPPLTGRSGTQRACLTLRNGRTMGRCKCWSGSGPRASKIGVARSRQGMLDDMEPGTKQGINPHPFTLRALKPELLMVLRHVGMDLLAYDGAPCGEAVGPLTEAARRIEADPGLCRSLQPAGYQGRYQFRNSGRPPMGRREVRRSSTWHHPQDPNRAALAVQLISPTGVRLLPAGDPHLAGDGSHPVRAGSRLALGFWTECP